MVKDEFVDQVALDLLRMWTNHCNLRDNERLTPEGLCGAYLAIRSGLRLGFGLDYKPNGEAKR